MFDTVPRMEWRRGWTYYLRWERGYEQGGVRSRTVQTPQQLRAVVEWAGRNDRIEKCSYELTWEQHGDLVDVCPAGHSLLAPSASHTWRRQLQVRLVKCAACPGHYVQQCPTCEVWVFDPSRRHGCGPDR